MKAKVFDTNEFKIAYNHKFFIDSNVWLYLFYPQSSRISKGIIESYSDFFKRVIERECLVQTNLIQLSEIINTVLQIEFKEHKTISRNHSISFKAFRMTPEGSGAINKAKTIVQQITRHSHVLSGIFGHPEILELIDNCDKADFNDLYFYQFCVKQDLILVTHDYDFSAILSEIQILSANNKFLH